MDLAFFQSKFAMLYRLNLSEIFDNSFHLHYVFVHSITLSSGNA